MRREGLWGAVHRAVRAGCLLSVLGLLILAAGCTAGGGEAILVESGDTVKVHYTGTLDDGSVFDSSEGKHPLQFTVGAGEMIPGFEAGVIGMQLNESKTIVIPADQAYGPYRADLLLFVDHSWFEEGQTPVAGQQVGLALPDGQVMRGTIVGVAEGGVAIDANHPLAGENLTFTIRMVDIL
jgi:peptidylprolyl isomerase